MGKISYEVSSPASRQAWDDLVADNDQVLVSQTPAWLDALIESGPYQDVSRLYVFADGTQVVLPLVQRRVIPGLIRLNASLPHGWGVGGSVSRGQLGPEHIESISTDLRALDGIRISIRPSPFQAALWDSGLPADWHPIPHGTHILDIQSGFEHYWKQVLSSSTRTKIRKAEKSGLAITRDLNGDQLPVFYGLYMQWIDDRARARGVPIRLARFLGKVREPYERLERVKGHLGEACQLWVASLEDEPVAASLLLIQGGHAFYWRNAHASKLSGPTRANSLLQRLMIEEACRQGCRYYHMGESGGKDSLKHYKEKFGAVEYMYNEYYYEKLPLSKWERAFQGLQMTLENRRMSSRADRQKRQPPELREKERN